MPPATQHPGAKKLSESLNTKRLGCTLALARMPRRATRSLTPCWRTRSGMSSCTPTVAAGMRKLPLRTTGDPKSPWRFSLRGELRMAPARRVRAQLPSRCRGQFRWPHGLARGELSRCGHVRRNRRTGVFPDGSPGSSGPAGLKAKTLPPWNHGLAGWPDGH